MIVITMLCSCSGQTLEAGSIIDLEKVITEYAWRELKRDSRWYNCLRRVDFNVEVPWNFFEFDHKTTRFKLRTGQGEDGFREKKQVELFRTDFTNSTNKDQVYKLRTQRQTKAATTVAIQRGFTLKGNTNFKLKIPQEIGHFGVSASTDGYLRVCRARGETFEDTFTWQVDSDVTVEPKHVTNARLIVTEDEMVADFEVRTSMRMPTGEAPVIVKRKSNKEIYAVLMISDLREVFTDVDCNILNIGKSESDSKKPRYAIEFITTGILESVRWRNQKICLESHPMKESPLYDSRAESTGSSDDMPLYSSAVFSRVLEHAAKEGDEDLPMDRYGDKSARVKKDLRFNVVPTVIKEPEEETFETPEKIISNLIREGIQIKSGHAPLGRSKATDDQSVIPSIEPQHRDLPSQAISSPHSSDLPTYRSLDSQSISITNISPTQQEVQYKTELQNIYFKSREGSSSYRPVIRDITQIVEEPEKEKAASMSKQSSMQSEEGTIDDTCTTESLDSGDSRKVSKVTSV